MKDLDKDIWHTNSDDQYKNWTKPNSHMITKDQIGIIDLPVETLGEIVENFGSGQLKTRYMFGSVENKKFTYLHRSMIFRFPDVITISLYELSDNTSSYSIFSRSVLGYTDFGTNRRRAVDWVNGLKTAIKRG